MSRCADDHGPETSPIALSNTETDRPDGDAWPSASHNSIHNPGVHNSIGTSWQRASTIILWIVNLEIENGARHSQMVQSD